MQSYLISIMYDQIWYHNWKLYFLCILLYIFTLRIHFYVKIKITSTTYNDFNLDKYYSRHDPEQHSRSFSHQSDILCNGNAGGNLITKKILNTLWKIILLFSVLKNSRHQLLDSNIKNRVFYLKKSV